MEKRFFFVYILPAILSIIIASAVMANILQNPDRELNIWPFSHSEGLLHSNEQIEILGLSKQYSTSQPIEIQVKISDSSFDCGDLYVTIYSSGKNDVVTQGGFFDQCFGTNGKNIPINDKFSKIIDSSGSYEVVAEMVSKNLKNILTSEVFTVK